MIDVRPSEYMVRIVSEHIFLAKVPDTGAIEDKRRARSAQRNASPIDMRPEADPAISHEDIGPEIANRMNGIAASIPPSHRRQSVTVCLPYEMNQNIAITAHDVLDASAQDTPSTWIDDLKFTSGKSRQIFIAKRHVCTPGEKRWNKICSHHTAYGKQSQTDYR